VFKVPTTHDVLTLFNPTYPKSHFDILSLFLLGSQIVVFLFFLYLHKQSINNDSSTESTGQGGWQTLSKGFFLTYFAFWRTMYDGGLGWILTKQSKKRWIVRWVKGKRWFDEKKNPKMRDWLRRQLEGKMGKDYAFDVRFASLSMMKD
jgi:phosphatidylethanolamine N-methyltransferase